MLYYTTIAHVIGITSSFFLGLHQHTANASDHAALAARLLGNRITRYIPHTHIP